MTARREIVVRSPKEAAIGVATLSGLMRRRRETITTPIISEPGGGHACMDGWWIDG